MGLDNKEQQLDCPCCDTCKDHTDFKKIVDLKDAGLVIYRHITRTEDVNKNTGVLETATNITEDVFILHNTKDVEISSVDFVPALERNKINCPRCRNIIEHAQKLLQKVPTIDKQDVTGVCAHCKRKERSYTPCCECAKIVKKFVTSNADKSDNTKRVKYWLSKIKHLLQDVRTETEDSEKGKYRTRSESYINTLPLDTPRPVHVPVIKPLFHSDTYRHDDVQTIPRSMENFQKINDANSYFYQPFLQKLDEPIMFIDSTKHTEKLTPNQEAALAVKEDTVDISNKIKSIFDGKRKTRDKKIPEESRMGHGLITSMAQFQEYEGRKQQKRWLSELPASNLETDEESTLQIADVHKKTGSYLGGFKKQDKITLKDGIAANRDETYNRQGKLVPSTKSTEDIRLVKETKPSSFSKSYRDKSFLQQPTLNKTQTVTAKTNTQTVLESTSQITKYHSEETLLTSVVGVTDDFLNKDFRYFFPKEISKTKKPKRLISSAELIKETQDMLLERAEEEKKRFEEERKKRLIEEEKKRIAHEEKKKLAEEKRIVDEERMKLSLEDRKRKVEEETKIVGEQKLEAVKNKNDFDHKSIKDEKLVDGKVISDKKKKSLTPSVTGTTIKSKSEKSNVSKPKGELRGKTGKDATKGDSAYEKLNKEKDGKGHENKKKNQMENQQNENGLRKRLKEEDTERSHMGKEATEKEMSEKKHEKEVSQSKKGLQKQPKIPGNEAESNEHTKGKDDQGDDELKMLLVEQAKQKDAELKRKKQQEQSEKLARETAIRKAKDSEERKYSEKEETTDSKLELDRKNSKLGKKVEKYPTTKELNINQIKVLRTSADDLILQLVKIKQSEPHTERKPNRISELKISPILIEEHKEHRNKKQSTCLMCIDSDLELDIESFLLKTDKSKEVADIIIGSNIFKYRPPVVQKTEEEGVIPLIFQSMYNEEVPVVKDKDIHKEILETIPEEPGRKPITLPTKSAKTTDQEAPKGIVRYALSDRTFIEKGWTLLPTEKVVRKMNVYRMRPAHPEFDWFEHNKNKRLMLYDSGEKLAEFDDKGRGRWYYRNGRLALDYYDAEESNAQQRFVVYSSGEPDERGRTHPITILATFDYLGNGIVFDHSGKIRLKYNQTEGVILDRSIGPVSHWKWHSLNDPPVLQQVMIDTQMAHKDPDILKMGGTSDNKSRPDNEEMLAIEFDNFIKEKSKKLSQTFKPFQIKMKALKINEHFSLKVLDQATVYLIFRDGTTNLKLNIGMILDHKEIVDTDTAELGDVSNNLERFPARTESLAALQRSVAYVQRYERSRNERERRLRPAEPCASADQLTAAVSRPLRPPLRSVKSSSTATIQDCYCKCSRKPSSFNVYYDNRLI